MLLAPDHINFAELRSMLEEEYGVGSQPLVFQPLGEDSWAFHSGLFWISVRRDLRGHVPGAYEAAVELHNSGLRYVLAPLVGADGRVVREINGSPLVVFPFVEASQTTRDSVSAQNLDQIVQMLHQVHDSRVDAELPSEDFRLSFENDLRSIFGFADDAAPAGDGLPGRLHQLLGRHRQRLQELYDEQCGLAGECLALRADPVLTHGEPSAPNVLRTAQGFLLADWGGAMWGPPERDWFHVRRTFGHAPTGRSVVTRFYEIKWILSEVAEYSMIFRESPRENGEIRAMWNRLTNYLPER
ncbi:phosphotransferase [Streptomyces sp. NPDC058525]|uniref:phosphotransferase n=1 Tax=Streptomyces sp. NPDC058525 TaxID=3346538 RepID=UPI00365492BF